jgi:hypothetical protein
MEKEILKIIWRSNFLDLNEILNLRLRLSNKYLNTYIIDIFKDEVNNKEKNF